MTKYIALALALAPAAAHAQFGVAYVFDGTQAANVATQIQQGAQLYTTTEAAYQTVVQHYNLYRQMIESPSLLYRPFLSPYTYVQAINGAANIYGNAQPWVDSANTGQNAPAAVQGASVAPVRAPIPGYAQLDADSQRLIAAQGATADIGAAAAANTLEAIGQVRSAQQLQSRDLNALESESNSADPSTQTTMAQARIANRLATMQMRSAQDVTSLMSAQALNSAIQAKREQDTINASFQDAQYYGTNYDTQVAPLFAPYTPQ